jgi:hypothetical protein
MHMGFPNGLKLLQYMLHQTVFQSVTAWSGCLPASACPCNQQPPRVKLPEEK